MFRSPHHQPLSAWDRAGLAFLAAIFWLWASLRKISDAHDHFIAALQSQSRLNAAAAFFAALAALVQGYLITQPTCINLSALL